MSILNIGSVLIKLLFLFIKIFNLKCQGKNDKELFIGNNELILFKSNCLKFVLESMYVIL